MKNHLRKIEAGRPGRKEGCKNPNAGRKKEVFEGESERFTTRIDKTILNKYGKKKCSEIARNAIRAVYAAEMGDI
jgi:hypothetical protein